MVAVSSNRRFLLQSQLFLVVLLKHRRRINGGKRKHRFWVRALFKSNQTVRIIVLNDFCQFFVTYFIAFFLACTFASHFEKKWKGSQLCVVVMSTQRVQGIKGQFVDNHITNFDHRHRQLLEKYVSISIFFILV